MGVEETVSYVFDSRPHVLAGDLARWMGDLPRFGDFVEAHRDKIRKKIRSAQSGDGLQDLRAELEAAYVLLREKRFALAYEPYGRGTGRGPDFAVTFRSRITFNVEVTRMRAAPWERGKGAPPLFEAGYEGRRLAEMVAGKLGQILPGMMNLLVIVADDGRVCELEVGRVMNDLKRRAEQKEPQLYRRHGFRGTADFFRYYQRLSGVLLRVRGDQEGGKCPVLWTNNQTKHPLPAPVCTILGR